MKKNIKLLLTATLIIFCVQSSKTFAQNNNKVKNVKDTLSFDEAKAKGEDFINKVLMQGGKASIKGISEEDGFYKIIVNANGQEYISYMTKDGKKFFPQTMDIDAGIKKYIDEHTAIKSDKPTIELFVMSYCPYGTQIEKGILPVLETLGNKIDFKLKFCFYAMHEQKELIEQLREYCLQKQKPQLLTSYLKCFLEEGKSNECLTKVGMDTVEIKNCMAVADTIYKVTEMYNDKSKWYNNKFPYFNVDKEDNTKYNIQGSPSLVINGRTMSSGRDSQSLLELICSAFNNPPKECKTKLSSITQNPGFGFKSVPVPGALSPNFVMTDNAGNNFEFHKYNGKAPYKLLLFWSADCEHCQQLVKGLNQWYNEPGNKEKLDIIAVGLDKTETEVQKWKNIIVNFSSWKHLHAEGGINSPIADNYAIQSTPIMFLVKSESNIIESVSDNLNQLIKDLK